MRVGVWVGGVRAVGEGSLVVGGGLGKMGLRLRLSNSSFFLWSRDRRDRFVGRVGV